MHQTTKTASRRTFLTNLSRPAAHTAPTTSKASVLERLNRLFVAKIWINPFEVTNQTPSRFASTDRIGFMKVKGKTPSSFDLTD
jgi:hypothetical protein